MLFGCTGYYSYENPYQPHFPGQENFIGPIVHPQKWTEEHDQQILGKKVAIIGSGATAVTILPSIADQGYFSSRGYKGVSYRNGKVNCVTGIRIYNFIDINA